MATTIRKRTVESAVDAAIRRLVDQGWREPNWGITQTELAQLSHEAVKVAQLRAGRTFDQREYEAFREKAVEEAQDRYR